jgi:two-component system, cell cycle sensor histidine kinase and response regulator CckA
MAGTRRRTRKDRPAGARRAPARGRRSAALDATQAALRESEARYRTLADRSIQGICIHRDFVVQFANPALASMLGFEGPGELLGLDLRSALAPGEPSPREARRPSRRRRKTASLRYECNALRPDGTRIWVEVMAAPVSWAGRPAVLATVLDISERKRAQSLAAGEVRVLEMIGSRVPLPRLLEELTRMIEAHADGMLASILLLDEDGVHLRHGAAPSLPDSYVRAIDGTAIGPGVGSCGTAAYLGEPTVASKIATDPRWADFRDLALSHGLEACWSTPIFSAGGRVLGTFALYYRRPGEPGLWELRLIEMATRLARIAIEHHRSEEDRARLAELVEEAPDAIIAVDTEGRLRAFNPAAERVSGYRATEVMGKPFAETGLLEAASLARAVQNFEGALIGQHRHPSELTIVRKDGSRLVLEANLRLMRRDGQIAGMQVTLRDLTGRRQAEEALRASEERYRLLFERNLAGVFRAASDGRVLECNPALAELLGYPSPEAVLAINATDVYADPQDRERLLARLQPGETLTDQEVRWRRADGREIWVLLSVRQMSDGLTTWREGIAIDITDRRRAEEAAREAMTLRTIAHLANGAAHEINNPLTTVVGRLDMLALHVAAGSEPHRLLMRARQASERIREIVERMHHITRVEYLTGSDEGLPPILDIRKSSPESAAPPRGDDGG